MGQQYITFYVKAPDQVSHKKVGALIKKLEFLNSRGPDDAAILARLEKAAQDINPDDGKRALAALRRGLKKIDPLYEPYQLYICNGDDKRTSIAGYWQFGFTFGGLDDAVGKASAMLAYLGRLVPDIDVRAFMENTSVGSETFARVIGNKVIWKHHDPGFSEAKDRKAFASGVYPWWHNGLPDKIKVGILNEPDYWEEAYT